MYDEHYAMVIANYIISLNEKACNGVSLLQTYNLNQGIKVFGERGEKAAFEEVNQLHKRECFKPII